MANSVTSSTREITMGAPDFTDPRRQLGGQLRELRKQSGLLIDTTARRIGRAAVTVSRLELAQKRRICIADIHAICQVLGATEAEEQKLIELARQINGAREHHTTA